MLMDGLCDNLGSINDEMVISMIQHHPIDSCLLPMCLGCLKTDVGSLKRETCEAKNVRIDFVLVIVWMKVP